MKIHIANPDKMRFDFMEKLFTYSIHDIGHDIVEIENADMIIWIQHGQREKHNGKISVLLQIEDRTKRPECRDRRYKPSGYDVAWGFNIDNPYESYLPLGYHPALDVECHPTCKYQIGFIGCWTQRRRELNDRSRNKFHKLGCWDYQESLRKCSEFKINIHVHSYAETRFTPWDRIARFLHGGLFFAMETCYCPMTTAIMFNLSSYDEAMDFWLSCSQSELFDLAHGMRQEYILNFDMRNLLEQKIKEVSNV